MEERADRFNAGKPRWSLVDFKSLEPLVQVLMFGAEKYGTIIVRELEEFINNYKWEEEKIRASFAEDLTLYQQKECAHRAILNLDQLKYVQFAETKNIYSLEGCVKIATMYGLEIAILGMLKDKEEILQIGEKLIKSGILQLKKGELQRDKKIQNIGNLEGTGIICQNTEYQQLKWIEEKKKVAAFAEIMEKRCTQTIAINLKDLEVYFVVSATTGLDSSTTMLRCLEKLLNISLSDKKFILLGDDNWKKGLPYKEVVDSMLRHIYAFLDGEDLDNESGLPHTGHILCNAMFLSHMFMNKKEFDNRRIQDDKEIDSFKMHLLHGMGIQLREHHPPSI